MDRLAALEIFVRVVDTGSFSAAARHQRIGQPAVSKAVVQLEKWLGVSLLMRSTRSVVPTEAGRIFYERAKRTIEEADEAVVAARGSASGLSGKLRVSTSVCLGRLHVIPNLPAFLAEHPALDIDLVLDDRNVDLVNEGIDVALRVGAMPDSNMTARRIAEGRSIVVATPAYLQRWGTPMSPSDLSSHQAIIYTRGSGGESWKFRKGAAEVSVVLQGRLKVTASEGLREAVNCGMGLAVSMEWNFSPELKSGKVVAVLEDWVLPSTNLSAVYPTGRLASTKARAFVSFVEGFMAQPDSVSPQRETYRHENADARRNVSRISHGPR
ncbi:LysR family transcriptional regulator [Bradyrhizobium erythrophlei]|jgi:DNA-binding transcriptional LysR family regulator|uniref:Transcriptional regulator, LysR family n=1 Tax=Bradyrhizobium erythrophlei TaxID=1437360 RepID=A0A1M5T594_9BRAD|nr:LysR family transcriptional regulator [Bradyrhizobium erythrophlei]SHH45872.1 transcriptional regulator, LysR family [Bradyrhizobium erythrophlei]